MFVTLYQRDRAAEKKAALEAELAAKAGAEKAKPKKRGRPRKQRTEK